MSSLFELLPDELVIEILDHVDDALSLARLASVSRRLCRISGPYLANVNLRSIWRDWPWRYRCSSFPELHDFVRLFLANPSLASNVYSLTMRDSWQSEERLQVRRQKFSIWPGGCSPYAKLNPTKDPVLVAAVGRHASGDVEASKLLIDLNAESGNDEDALVALLLSALPNLERLDVMVGTPYTYFYRTLDKQGTTTLSSLKSIFLTYFDDKNGIDVTYTTALFKLPSLKAIHLHRAGTNSCTQNLYALKTGSSNVDCIELKSSHLDTEDLENMIRSCKNLKTFIYEKGESLLRLNFQQYNIQHIHSTLAPAYSTLENLWLDYEPGIRGDPFVSFDRLERLDFTPYIALKRLHIAARFILGANHGLLAERPSEPDDETGHDYRLSPSSLADVLPQTLEILRFANCNGQVTILKKYITELLECKNISMPNLKKIIIEAMFRGEKNRFDLDELVELADSVSVFVERLDTKVNSDALPKSRGWGWDGSVEWTEPVRSRYETPPVYDNLDKGRIIAS